MPQRFFGEDPFCRLLVSPLFPRVNLFGLLVLGDKESRSIVRQRLRYIFRPKSSIITVTLSHLTRATRIIVNDGGSYMLETYEIID